MSDISLPAAWRDLYPFTPAAFTLAAGHVMRYLDEGDKAKSGETILALHGNPTWSFFYRDLVKHFRPACRVIAPDHLGMGLSAKPKKLLRLQDHIANLDALTAAILAPGEQVTLVVHDWGGAIGFGWAAARPERVKRLVILNTAAFIIKRLPRRIRLCRPPVLGKALVCGLNGFARAATYCTTCQPLAAATRAGYLYPYDNWANRRAIWQFVQDIPLAPSHPSWQTIMTIDAALKQFKKTPALIQWGGRDWCFNDLFYTAWRERLPNAAADYYPLAGHYLLEDAGKDILPRIEKFIAATP